MKTSSDIQIPIIGAEDPKETYTLPSRLVSQPMNAHLLTQYVQMYLVNQREGHAATKDRSQITATTKKMYKQKGTGNARHGSAKAPIFVGGGVVGGPKPKDYYLKMNKKQKTLAFLSALTQRVTDKELAVLAKDTGSKERKTKEIASLFHTFSSEGSITLVLHTRDDENLNRIARNIKNVHIVNVQSLNPYEILEGKKILFSDSALAELIKTSKP